MLYLTELLQDALEYARDHGYSVIEVPEVSEEAWTTMVDTNAALSPFTRGSYFYGSNVPGKPRRYLINPGGRPKLLEMMAEVVENDYKGFMR